MILLCTGLAGDMMNNKPVLPACSVNVPIDLIFDQSREMSAAIILTYLQLLALASNPGETVQISWSELCELTKKAQPMLYGHLTCLRNAGFLRFSTVGKVHIIIVFSHFDLKLIIKNFQGGTSS